MESVFYYLVTLHQGSASGPVVAPWVTELPLANGGVDPSPAVVVLTQNSSLPDGMYLWNGTQWRLALPYMTIAQAIVMGATIELFYDMDSEYDGLPASASVWKNAVFTSSTTITAGVSSTWGAMYVTAAGGTVKSVNNVGPDGNGNVPIAIADIPGLQAALNNAGSVKTVDSQSPDVNGNIVVKAQDVVAGTATSLISADGSTTGTIVLRKIAAGTGIVVALDGNGNVDVRNSGVLTVNGTAPNGSGNVTTPSYVPTVGSATATNGQTLISTAGAAGVGALIKQLVAGTNVTLTTDANGITISAAGGSSGITQVTTEGTGTSLVGNDGTTGGIAILKSLAAGSNVTITQAGDGKTLTIAANQVLNPATTTAIGGVIVKAGLAVDGSGNLSLAAPTGVNLGGVKAGTGITIAADGTISASGAVSSVSGQTGTVVVQASDTSTASGTSLISDSGSTTANIKIKRLVAGSNVTLAPDSNGNLQISSTLAATVTSFATGTSGQLHGDIVFAAGQAISLSNTGNTIQINGTGVPEAPNDGNLYGRQNQGWVVIPSTSNPIVAVNGQAGTGAVLMVEASPPANTAVIKSLVAGANITLSETGGLITITAAIPAGTVATVNSKGPDGSGNVTLAASDVSALPISGGSMTGDINTAGHKVTGLPTPTVASDAIPYSFITGLVIDGGVIG